MTSGLVPLLVRYTGLAAIALLFGTLAVSPLGTLLARSGKLDLRGVARVRRACGITTACVALGHALLALALWVRGPLFLLLEWPFLRAGLLALLVLGALLATSFPILVRALHLHAWKELHRLAHLAAAFALLHLSLAPFGSPALLLGLLVLAGLLLVVRLLAHNRA